jgi:hypothetical protein
MNGNLFNNTERQTEGAKMEEKFEKCGFRSKKKRKCCKATPRDLAKRERDNATQI